MKRYNLESKTLDGLDIKKGLKLFGGDEETYVRLLSSFVKNIKESLKLIATPEKDKLYDYMSIVHRIKGSCLSVGVDKIASKAEELEIAATEEDFDFVKAHNDQFIDEVNKFTSSLEEFTKALLT